MTGWHWLILVSGLAILVASAWGGLSLWQRRHIRTAREEFDARRQLLSDEFLRAASATGKPRGLRWVACDWNPETAFARDRKTGQLAALVAVTIRFEAVEGGDMEGVEAVGNLRHASAVFFYDRGRWQTAGRALFNLGPAEALAHLHEQYQRLPDAV
jgi:hypothetical protein